MSFPVHLSCLHAGHQQALLTLPLKHMVYETVGWHHRLSGHKFEQVPGRTGKPGVLQSMGLQRVGHDLATEQQLKHIPLLP